jgi:ASF1 like histone chaperone
MVKVIKVNSLKTKGLFTEPFSFDVTYEALKPLYYPLVWKIVFMGGTS